MEYSTPGQLVFVGDPHISANTPSSRKETNEEYRALQIKKLKYIYEDIAGPSDWVIILGDVFHSSALSMMSGTPKFYNDIIDIMKTRRTMTIIGNHDMYYRNEDSHNVTILENLFKTGVEHLNLLNSYTTICNYEGRLINLYGVDYGHDFPKLEPNPKDFNIIVAHSFFEDRFYGAEGNSNLTESAIEQLGQYNLVVLGHDHAAYPITTANNGKTIVVRPGSLLRGTSHTCQINRIPQVAVLDLDTLECKYEVLPVAPGKEVFKEKVILEKDIDVNVENILENMNSFDRTQSIYQFIKSQETRGKEVFGDRYYDVINIIEQYLDTFGIIKGGSK